MQPMDIQSVLILRIVLQDKWQDSVYSSFVYVKKLHVLFEIFVYIKILIVFFLFSASCFRLQVE